MFKSLIFFTHKMIANQFHAILQLKDDTEIIVDYKMPADIADQFKKADGSEDTELKDCFGFMKLLGKLETAVHVKYFQDKNDGTILISKTAPFYRPKLDEPNYDILDG